MEQGQGHPPDRGRGRRPRSTATRMRGKAYVPDAARRSATRRRRAASRLIKPRARPRSASVAAITRACTSTPATTSCPTRRIRAGYLAGVPWVLADAKDPKNEAPDASTLPAANNYLAEIAEALVQTPRRAAIRFSTRPAGGSRAAAGAAGLLGAEGTGRCRRIASHSRSGAVNARRLAGDADAGHTSKRRTRTKRCSPCRRPKELAHVVDPGGDRTCDARRPCRPARCQRAAAAERGRCTQAAAKLDRFRAHLPCRRRAIWAP